MENQKWCWWEKHVFLKPYYTTWDAPLTICVCDAVIRHLPKVLQQRDFAAGCSGRESPFHLQDWCQASAWSLRFDRPHSAAAVFVGKFYLLVKPKYLGGQFVKKDRPYAVCESCFLFYLFGFWECKEISKGYRQILHNKEICMFQSDLSPCTCSAARKLEHYRCILSQEVKNVVVKRYIKITKQTSFSCSWNCCTYM